MCLSVTSAASTSVVVVLPSLIVLHGSVINSINKCPVPELAIYALLYGINCCLVIVRSDKFSFLPMTVNTHSLKISDTFSL